MIKTAYESTIDLSSRHEEVEICARLVAKLLVSDRSETILAC